MKRILAITLLAALGLVGCNRTPTSGPVSNDSNGVKVTAPGTDVEVQKGRVKVTAPGTNVDVERK